MLHGTPNANKVSVVAQSPLTVLKRVENMPSLSLFRPSLSCILQKIPRTSKFNPFCLVKIEPKVKKSSDHDQNLVVYAADHDAPAHQISDNSLHAFLLQWRKHKSHYFFVQQRAKIGQKSNPFLMWLWYTLACQFRAIPSMCSQNKSKFFRH